MGSHRDYMRDYMRQKRLAPTTFCACGARAVRMVAGNEGICARCLEFEQHREVLCKRGVVKKWNKPELDGGGRFWREKLEMWLPNPTPGWGSLAMIEAKLRILQGS